MTRPLYSSNLAPKDDGGIYDVVHLCDGLAQSHWWDHAWAVRIAASENGLQSDEGSRQCAAGEQCSGFVVWRGAR